MKHANFYSIWFNVLTCKRNLIFDLFSGIGITDFTPVVFCAVTAVIAVIAQPPRVVIVFISAWIPAPPDESDPAITKF